MNLKQKKEVARQILKDAAKHEGSIKFKAACIGMEYNEQGQFHSLVLEVEASYKHSKGELNLIKNMLLPISLVQDVVIFEPEEKKETTKKRKATVAHSELS